jgi:hypothetical protein
MSNLRDCFRLLVNHTTSVFGSDVPVACTLPQRHWDFMNVRDAAGKVFFRLGRGDGDPWRAVLEPSHSAARFREPAII